MQIQRDIDRQGGFSPAFSGSLEGHVADKAAQQDPARARDTASSPVQPVQLQQDVKVRYKLWQLCDVSFDCVACCGVSLPISS